MSQEHFTLLDEGRACSTTASVTSAGIRLPAADLQAALGWELKPQGLCKDDRCVPIAARSNFANSDGVDLAAFAALLSRPLAVDLDERTAYLGASAADRSAQLTSLDAPDFTLPDLSGQLHSLSSYRGKKIFLVAYASW